MPGTFSQMLFHIVFSTKQREHHEKEDFKSELLRLLRAHEVEFDERYVFD